MARVRPVTADPAADAALLLRRLAFAILMLAIPLATLVARRALVILAPIAVVLLVIAAAIDGSARPLAASARRVFISPGGLAGALLLAWCALSLVWTPFFAQASERLVNILATLGIAVAGYLALPDRMRSSNLYILPVGVALGSLAAAVLVLLGTRPNLDGDTVSQNLERGLIVLVLLLWPALAWLRSRDRDVEALLLAIAVTLAVVLAPDPLPVGGLAAGAVIFALTGTRPSLGTKVTGGAMAGLVLVAPLIPLVLTPMLSGLAAARDNTLKSLLIWRDVVLNEPARLITGHGFESALRGRNVGLLAEDAPRTLLFEIWYDLGIVGAAAAAVALYAAARGAGRDHPPLVPGMMAALAAAFTLACLGIGTAQMWWFTALAITVVIFVAASRGQFRTRRPKAVLRGRQSEADL
jgi:hypothetical protein